MNRIDRDALDRAIETKLQRGGVEAQHIEDMLAREPWERVGKFAAYSCQIDSLKLRPWQMPPVSVNVDDRDPPGESFRGISRAAALLGRLLHRGLSRYEPDPLHAIAAEQKEGAASSVAAQ